MQRLITLDDAVTEAAQNLLNENLRILNEYATRLGPEKATTIALTSLQGFVGSLIYKVLKQNPGPLYSREEIHDLVQKEFANMKFNIQTAVSAGVQTAMSNWSGVHVEYYCQIRPVPEPANKKLC